MPLGRAIYRENRVRDGVTYEVVVYAMPGGVYGTYRCPICDLTEVNGIMSPNDAEALRMTLLGVDEHHAAKHQPNAS
jgi:hypothetical protein